MHRTRRTRDAVAALAAAALLLGCGDDRTADSGPDRPVIASPGSSRPTASTDTATQRTLGASATTTAPPPLPTSTTTPPFAATPTTRWTPPAIPRPTTPYTLPADYGTGGATCDGPAPPRTTLPPEAVLATMVWTVDDALTITFDPPGAFAPDPLPLPAIGDCDRANGLFLLERWFVPEQPGFAGLSVQADPGDDSPLLSRTEFSDTIVGADVTWYLWNGATVEQTGAPANMGLTVLGDYLLMIHGTPDAMRTLAAHLTIEASP